MEGSLQSLSVKAGKDCRDSHCCVKEIHSLNYGHSDLLAKASSLRASLPCPKCTIAKKITFI